MAMKRVIYAVMMVGAALMWGCNKDEDMLTKQKDAIVRYLTSSRRLVAKEEVGNTIAENPPFYTQFGQDVFQHITNYYEEGRSEWALVESTSTLDINFAAYIFSGSEPSKQQLYWSNIPALISEVESSNNNQYDHLIWSEEPLTLQLGNGSVVRGLEEALIGCHAQDSVQVYMTSAAAYGKHALGMVPRNSSVAWYIKILNVTK